MRLDSGFRPPGDASQAPAVRAEPVAAAASSADADLQALSPREVPWSHPSMTGLAQAALLVIEAGDGDSAPLCDFLASIGYARIARATIARAADLLRQEPPRAVLLRLGEQPEPGLRLLAALRDDAQLRHLPVIALDATRQAATRRQVLALGAADVLPHPGDAAELALRLRNLLAVTAYRDHVAQHDALTGLPMRARFMAVARQVLAAAVERKQSGAILHMGVDGLRRVNEALGHAVGDQVLQRIAKRLAACVRTEADGELSAQGHDPSLYRLEGDEFVIVIPFMEGLHSAAAFISKVLEDGAAACHPHGAPELFVTCSVGVSVFPRDGADAGELLCNAGLALREAKRGGTQRYEFFVPELKEAARRRLDLGGELRHAVRRDQIELLYAPVVELAGGRMAGAQAVLRWRQGGGRVFEGEALADLAAASQMDLVFTEWTFEQLRTHAHNWRAAGLQPLPVRLAVSLASLRGADLLQLVQAVTATGLDARMLVLELRHLPMAEALPRQDAAALAALRKMGVRLALDRFGAGGSPAHLRAFAGDEVKADLAWLAGEGQDARGQALALGLRELARAMRVACVAGGVDAPAQLELLRRQGWDQAQGRAVGEPLPGLEFAARWLTRTGKPQRVSLPAG